MRDWPQRGRRLRLSKVRSRRVWWLSLLAWGCVVIVSACGGSQPGQAPSTGGSPSSEEVLKLLYWQAPTILNPHLSVGLKDLEASRLTLEPLATYTASGELVPILAATVPTLENGGVAADGRSVTWELKPGVTWSDGTPFTAADVVFTHRFIADPAVGAISAGTYEQVERVEAIADHTVKITFKDVNPGWSEVFVGTQGMILPAHAYADHLGENAREAPANLRPIGTGPYRVVQFKPGDVVVYEPNPTYREAGKPAFRRVELKGGGDATSAARAVLQTGDADFAYNLQVEAPVLETLLAAGQGQVTANFGPQVERVLVNLTDPNREVDGDRSSLKAPHPFLSDVRVRRAFNLAMDREAIATQLYGRTGKPTANFLVSPALYNSPNTTYTFDLAQAKALLDQAGWQDTNGNGTRDKDGVEMQLVFQTSVNPLRQKTQAVIKQALESIGVGVQLKSVDASIFFASDPNNTDNSGHFYADLQMFTTGNTSPDPTSYMKTYTCDEIAQKANNWTKGNVSRYCNPAYDALWQEAAQELNAETRQQLMIQMNDLLVNEAVVLPLVHRAETAGVSHRLVGVNLTPWDLNTWNIAEWRRP